MFSSSLETFCPPPAQAPPAGWPHSPVMANRDDQHLANIVLQKFICPFLLIISGIRFLAPQGSRRGVGRRMETDDVHRVLCNDPRQHQPGSTDTDISRNDVMSRFTTESATQQGEQHAAPPYPTAAPAGDSRHRGPRKSTSTNRRQENDDQQRRVGRAILDLAKEMVCCSGWSADTTSLVSGTPACPGCTGPPVHVHMNLQAPPRPAKCREV